MNGLNSGGQREEAWNEGSQEGRPTERWFEMSDLTRGGLKRGGLK
jgi:hypothetical protein